MSENSEPKVSDIVWIPPTYTGGRIMDAYEIMEKKETLNSRAITYSLKPRMGDTMIIREIPTDQELLFETLMPYKEGADFVL
jgi:hypothetical protein